MYERRSQYKNTNKTRNDILCSPKISPNFIRLFVRTFCPPPSRELNASWSWTVGQTEHRLPELWENVTTTYSVFSFYLLPVCLFKVADLLWWEYFLFFITPVDLTDHDGRWQVSLIKKHLLFVCIFLDQSIKMLQHWSHGHLLLRGSEWLDIAVLGGGVFCSACLHLAQSNWQVFLISAPVGSQQNKQTWPPAPCICRCALSLSQMHLSCLPPAAWGGEPHTVHVKHTHMQTTDTHINADCQSPIERRDTTETNMSLPQAWDCYHPIEKAVVAWGKKQKRLLIDSDSLCVHWYQCVFV